MAELVKKLFQTYGVQILISNGDGTVSVVGMFQPVRSKSWDTMDSEYSPLGEIPRGRYIYLGPVTPTPEAGNTMTVAGKNYLVRRTEVIYGPDGPAYCWGLCLEKGGADTWGRQS